jgi:benzoyl-CoA 2,3-dioxygenase component A
VVIERRRVAVDPAVCSQCGDCADECATDAIAVLRRVPADTPYSVQEQLHWDELPPQEMGIPP